MHDLLCFLNDNIVVREYLYLTHDIQSASGPRLQVHWVQDSKFKFIQSRTSGFARFAVNPPFRLEPSERPAETLATGVGFGLGPPSASGDIDSLSEPDEKEAFVSFNSEAGGKTAASCGDAVPIGVFEVLGGEEGLEAFVSFNSEAGETTLCRHRDDLESDSRKWKSKSKNIIKLTKDVRRKASKTQSNFQAFSTNYLQHYEQEHET
ncbi:N-(5'-phosphoribosyl)anthranilate isomerase [Striga asiatica]|uniref:N-(5'-phosphoribosyl)anthranilate isomerase n=1 Tax=Striga asiatica TaxID=4170 RepID=A0A5A7PS30_STRAF|nr:N-(5'-phosphoribosyl)anthranilate isomerase [Striga asiatica]